MKSIHGVVEKGKQFGKALGYPTANIQLTQQVDAGIYAARAEIEGDTHIAAVFIDPASNLLEAHLLDFSGDLYGKEVKIELAKKIRESKKFEKKEYGEKEKQ